MQYNNNEKQIYTYIAACLLKYVFREYPPLNLPQLDALDKLQQNSVRNTWMPENAFIKRNCAPLKLNRNAAARVLLYYNFVNRMQTFTFEHKHKSKQHLRKHDMHVIYIEFNQHWEKINHAIWESLNFTMLHANMFLFKSLNIIIL